ncbi:MAG TPA: hypothetical protein DD725_05600 [Deltaproteobacteria bacterium]|nr:hypothetical protein [Deltaproteobacteria bacterium]
MKLELLQQERSTKGLLDVEGLSEALNIPVSSIYKLTHLKQIPHVKIGKTVRFRESEVSAWLDSKTITPAGQPEPEIQTKARKAKVRKSGRDTKAIRMLDELIAELPPK